MRLLCASALLLIAFAAPLRAQSALDSLAPRTTVRVWSPELSRRSWTGLVWAVRPDSLEVQRKKELPRSISRGSITRLDVSVRRTRAQGARTFGLFGLAQGALTGAMLGLMTEALGARYYPNGTDQPPASIWAFDVPVGAAIGGAVGVVGGALFPGSSWRTVVRNDP